MSYVHFKPFGEEGDQKKKKQNKRVGNTVVNQHFRRNSLFLQKFLKNKEKILQTRN